MVAKWKHCSRHQCLVHGIWLCDVFGEAPVYGCESTSGEARQCIAGFDRRRRVDQIRWCVWALLLSKRKPLIINRGEGLGPEKMHLYLAS